MHHEDSRDSTKLVVSFMESFAAQIRRTVRDEMTFAHFAKLLFFLGRTRFPSQQRTAGLLLAQQRDLLFSESGTLLSSGPTAIRDTSLILENLARVFKPTSRLQIEEGGGSTAHPDLVSQYCWREGMDRFSERLCRQVAKFYAKLLSEDRKNVAGNIKANGNIFSFESVDDKALSKSQRVEEKHIRRVLVGFRFLLSPSSIEAKTKQVFGSFFGEVFALSGGSRAESESDGSCLIISTSRRSRNTSLSLVTHCEAVEAVVELGIYSAPGEMDKGLEAGLEKVVLTRELKKVLTRVARSRKGSSTPSSTFGGSTEQERGVTPSSTFGGTSTEEETRTTALLQPDLVECRAILSLLKRCSESDSVTWTSDGISQSWHDAYSVVAMSMVSQLSRRRIVEKLSEEKEAGEVLCPDGDAGNEADRGCCPDEDMGEAGDVRKPDKYDRESNLSRTRSPCVDVQTLSEQEFLILLKLLPTVAKCAGALLRSGNPESDVKSDVLSLLAQLATAFEEQSNLQRERFMISKTTNEPHYRLRDVCSSVRRELRQLPMKFQSVSGNPNDNVNEPTTDTTVSDEENFAPVESFCDSICCSIQLLNEMI
ncbi:unnamed protein product [Amoebophrya sp. A25]|nr:unnamed protein product [Amoebophrya sp. A25]|eukprot:GSA25T00019738001.1